MEKILLIALCLGFAMTQSIQTKQVEVTIADWNSINLYELLDESIGGNYRVKLNDVDFNGTDSDDFCTNIEFGIYIQMQI